MFYQALTRDDAGRELPRGPHFVDVVCRPAAADAGSPFPGSLFGASPTGICLHSRQRFGVSEVLVVEVPPAPGIPEGLQLQAQVVSVERTPVLGDWVFACALVRCALSAEAVRALAGRAGVPPDEPGASRG